MARTRWLGGLMVAAGLLALAGWPGGPGARGQVKAVEAKAGEPKTFTDAVTLPTNRESRGLIKAAEDYITKKEWHVAAGCLQTLLEAKEDSFIDIEAKDEKGELVKRRVSVRTEANRLIGELPPEGLQFYQVQYGPAADNLLKEALDKNDPSLLAKVAVIYFHTKAGAEATALLGTYHLDRGSYLMAALSFERLLNRPDADKLPVKVLFKAALACRRAGELENAEKAWKKMADKVGRTELVFGRQKVTLAQLRTEYERTARLLTQLGQNDWPLFHGNPARNAQGVGSTAFLEARWQYSMTPLDETNPLLLGDVNRTDVIAATGHVRTLLASAAELLQGKPQLPAFFAVAADGKLVFRTYDGVHAVSLKDQDTADGKIKAGELLWISRAAGGLHGMLTGAERRSAAENWYKYYAQQGTGPAGALFENALTGSLSHDGQRAYFVDDLALPPHPNMIAQNMGNPAMGFSAFDREVHFSRLTAVEMDTGKVKWTIPPGEKNAKPGRDATEVKETNVSGQEFVGTFFLGPPLPLGGKLYLLIEKNTELRLVCLDPARLVGDPKEETPEIVWQQSLGTAQYRLSVDPLRRLQAAHLAYGDGILVCPTNAGIILGVDLLSHSLVWAHSYRDGTQHQLDEIQMQFRGGRGFRGVVPVYPGGSPAQERWRPAAPVIQNGKVVFTAHDGAAPLQCLNLRDGRLLWHVKRGDDDLYLAGVFGQRVVIVGKSFVRALNLDDGKELWKLPTGSLPSGQGAASEDVYYLPLQAAGEKKEPGILAINLVTGKTSGPPARSRKKEPLGNLLFVEGELVSQTAQAVAAYPELKRMLAEIDRRLKENPNDPLGLTERGELYLDKGDLPRAVADLRTALAHTPPADTRVKARNKLYEALTELLQNDFNAAEKYVEEYHELCRIEPPADADSATKQRLADEQFRREANFLSLVGRGREGQGRLIDAFLAYERFGALTGNRELIGSIDEPNTRSRPDVWSRGRIKGMYDRASPEQRKQLEEAIAQRWAAVRDKDDLDAVRKFVAVFGTSFRVGREAQLQLAERLLADGGPDELTEAEAKLQSLCFSPELRRLDPTSAAKAVEVLIRIYTRRSLYEDAVGLYKQLGTEFATVTVRDGKTGGDLYNELFTDKRFLPYLEPLGLLWKGTLKPHDTPGRFDLTRTSLAVAPEGDLLPFFERHRLVLDIDLQGGNTWQLNLLDRATNEKQWEKPLDLPPANYFRQQRFPGDVSGGREFGPVQPRYAFAKGHTLVVHLNNLVFTYNLAERRADRREVWRYNLYGKHSLLNSNPQQIDLDDQGRLGINHPNGQKERMGGVAVVESNYVCLQARIADESRGGHREGLIALDPHQPGPNVLWTKTDIPLRAQVFGDDQHVYVFEPAEGGAPPTVRALRAQDGVYVPVPDFGRLFPTRIRTLGRCLLLHEDDSQGGTAMRLYDVQTGQDVWRRGFSAGATVLKSEDPALTGVVEKDHTVTFLDVRTGGVLFKSLIQAEHAEKLRAVALITDRDRFYLALNRTPESGVSWNPNTGFGLRSLHFNGPVYALNRTSGKLEWVCDFVPHQTLLLEQVQDLPVLLFTSQYSKQGSNGSLQRNAVRVTGVDKRTGKLIFDKEFAPNPQFHALRADPLTGVIELFRQDLKISFRVERPQSVRADGVAPLIQ